MITPHTGIANQRRMAMARMKAASISLGYVKAASLS